jgi:hypothetical protein
VQVKYKLALMSPKYLDWLVKAELGRRSAGQLIFPAHRHSLLRNVVFLRRIFLVPQPSAVHVRRLVVL